MKRESGIDCEIICVGSELLTGRTLNTNAQFLAKQLTDLGCDVRRIEAIGDDVDEIARSIKDGLSRKVSLIITTGGLGPTFDDKTLEGISKAIDEPLRLNKKALKMIEDWYKKAMEVGLVKRFELTRHRLKMARLPLGSKALQNPVGTAPGVLIERRGTTIVALPGVPEEMRAMFGESVVPIIRSLTRGRFYFEEFLDVAGILESDLAPLIEDVMRTNPQVYIKSHPRRSELESTIKVQISTRSYSLEEAKKVVKMALKELSLSIEEHGGKIGAI